MKIGRKLGLAGVMLVFGLCGASAVRAQQTAPPAPAPSEAVPRTHPHEGIGPINGLEDLRATGKMLFKLADSDNNNAISQKEAVDLGNLVIGGFFFRMDANGDGKISKEESQQARQALYQKRPWLRFIVERTNQQQRKEGEPDVPQTIRALGSLIDSNQDRQVEATEVRQLVQSSVQSLFVVADTNRDGQISPSEVDQAVLNVINAAAQALFQTADKDKNGTLSQGEFVEALADPARTVFAILDANADGQLASQELQRAERVIAHELRMLDVPEPAYTETSFNQPHPNRTAAPAPVPAPAGRAQINPPTAPR